MSGLGNLRACRQSGRTLPNHGLHLQVAHRSGATEMAAFARELKANRHAGHRSGPLVQVACTTVAH